MSEARILSSYENKGLRLREAPVFRRLFVVRGTEVPKPDLDCRSSVFGDVAGAEIGSWARGLDP